MNWTIILIILFLLILADKVLTVMNVNAVTKNFPDAIKNDPYKIEKNPIAKYFFVKFGLLWGSVIMSLLSIFQMYIAYYLLNKAFNSQIALWVIIMLYGLVIVNNIFFYLKYSKII